MPAEEANMVKTALIFAGGIPPRETTLKSVRALADVQLVIAADSGLHTAQQLGMKVDVVIGDMDSVDSTALDMAKSAGAKIVLHHREKDQTDAHLALVYAGEHAAERIVVVTAGGGRLDHQLGLVAAMFDPLLKSSRVEALWDDSHLYALQGSTQCEWVAQHGDVVGLQAFGGYATGISTTGLRWQLNHETLLAHSSRGVSNEVTATQVKITVETGQLLIIHQKKEQPNES